MLRQNRTEKVGERKKKKNTISYNCQLRNTSGTAAARSIRQCNNVAESLNDESSDEEGDDYTTCVICKIPSIKLLEKCGGSWVEYDICDEYI